MKREIPLALVCILLAPLSAPAQDALDSGTARPSLDLSLPPDAPHATSGAEPAASGPSLPDLGGGAASGAGSARHGKGPRSDLPYGAGYEARHGSGGAGRGGGRGR